MLYCIISYYIILYHIILCNIIQLYAYCYYQISIIIICIYIYIYLCVYIYIYIYIHMYTHTYMLAAPRAEPRACSVRRPATARTCCGKDCRMTWMRTTIEATSGVECLLYYNILYHTILYYTILYYTNTDTDTHTILDIITLVAALIDT